MSTIVPPPGTLLVAAPFIVAVTVPLSASTRIDATTAVVWLVQPRFNEVPIDAFSVTSDFAAEARPIASVTRARTV